MLFLFALLSFALAALGVCLSAMQRVSRKVVPFSGLVLVLISLFWVLPELAPEFGWSVGLGLLLAGVALLWVVDRYIYPVCPACSHTHDHDSCSTRLHGFATPLIAAALAHSVFDGWMFIAFAEISWGVVIHKLPESLAFGVILRAALRSRSRALLGAALAQGAMLLGGGVAMIATPRLGTTWMMLLLALAGGTFLYLGLHAMHTEWRRRVSSGSLLRATE